MTTLLNPPEVELQKAIAVAQEKGDGAFTVRVTKKNPNSMVPVSVVSFNDGTIAHLANLESWVPRLVGGGEYTIVAIHPSNLGQRFVFAVNFAGAPFATVNVAMIQAQDWSGPTHITQVAEQQQPTPVAPPAFQATPFAATPRPILGAQIPVTPAGAQAFAQMQPDAGAQLLAVQRHAAEAEAKVAAREAALAQRETEEKLRREMQDREAKHAREMAELKQLISAQQKPAEKVDYVAIAAGVAAALAPIVTAFTSSSNESRRQATEQANKLAELQASSAREIAAINAKAQETQTALLMKLTERPGTSPEMTAMLEVHKASTESQAAMMNQIVNATGMVSKMSIGMIETIAEMNAPPEGSPILEAVKEGVKALGALAGGTETGAKKAIAAQQASMQKAQQPQRSQQPVVPQPTAEQIQAARARAAQVNQQAAAQQAAFIQAQQPQTPPAVVVPFPNAKPVPVVQAPQPIVPPSQQVIESPVQPQQGFAGAPEEMPDGFAHIQTKSVLDSIEELIRAEHEPAPVATLLFDSLGDREFKAALEEVNGDPEVLLVNRLGLPWCAEHKEYLEKLGDEIERIGEERGLFGGDEEDGDQPDDQQQAGGGQ